MESITELGKCCGPQHLSGDEPSHAWSPQQLGQYAHALDLHICTAERKLAPLYWEMGQALHLARKHFARGQWGTFLEEHAIDRPRASKAIAIFRAIASVAQVESLTVEQAYAQRPRTARVRATKGRRTRARAGTRSPLRAGLTQIAQLATEHLQAGARLRRAEARQILTLVTLAIDRLEAVRKQLSPSHQEPEEGC